MGTTADKLQRLIEGKQAIVDAINSKANTSLTINSKLSNIASVISNISGSGGVNISDATANANDILKGKTAYTAYGKVEGTIETYNGENENGAILDDMLQARVDSNNSCEYLFYYYTGNNVDFIKNLDTSNVTDMNHMFSNCSALTSVPQLDTSNVTTIDHMFSSCSVLTNVPQLDTSKATDMSYMFYKCEKLTTIDITYYNISNTSYIANFANGCTALKSLIIREFGANYVLSSNSFTGSGIVNGTGYIYVPRAMVDILSQSTNWSTYASQIRALEDYTVDGTTTGALDETKI